MAESSEEVSRRPARILLVDDDQIVLDSLGGFLTMEGYDVSAVADVMSAIRALQGSPYDLVITDVSMPIADGFELLRHIRTHHPAVAVILVTGYGTIESAVEAIKRGAQEYLTKPIIDDDVRTAVRRALHQQELLAKNRRLKNAMADRHGLGNIISISRRMAKVFELVTAAADSNATVLITGESGTGKSMTARAIHAHSPRRDRQFVEVSCGALPDALLESELFGHVRGAFTDAVVDKPGKFAVDGGTVFLDEISSASPQLQAKLLRVLQEHQFEPVGSNETIDVDVRVILATNHDLWAEVEAGRFRRDLFYRINVIDIELPPLRQRVEDVPLLAEHFLGTYLPASGKRVQGFSAEATELMQRYAWPGNVRELENCVERAVVLCRGRRIGPEDLPDSLTKAAASRGPAAAGRTTGTLKEALVEPEKQIIVAALQKSGGSRQAAASKLGINRTTLYKKMKSHGLME